jgi:dolichol-phosphate mannosyltransferase
MLRQLCSDRATAVLGLRTAAGMPVLALWNWRGSVATAATWIWLPTGLSITVAAVAGFLFRQWRASAAVVAALAVVLGHWHGGVGVTAAALGFLLVGTVLYGLGVGGIASTQGKDRVAPARSSTAAHEPPRDIGSREQVWIVLPTYMEGDNVRWLLAELRRLLPTALLLVVDDDSPDGTAEVVRELAYGDPHVRLHLRQGERGLDGALQAGFQEALAAGADTIVTMDADGSHDPHEVSRLLDALVEADIAVGSRYVAGGCTKGWPRWRRILSLAANAYARHVLSLDIRDCSSGFRAYRGAALLLLLPQAPAGAGYAVLEAMLFGARCAELTVVEVPICFRERRSGTSKLGLGEVWRGARALWRLRAQAPTASIRTPRGFTLMELLTVLAILSILMGILLPMLASARRAVQVTSCQSNTRQLALALQLYAQDYDGIWPRWTNGAPGGVWDSAIYPYVRDPRIYHCPSNPQSLDGAVVRSYALPRNVSGLSLAAIPRPADTVTLYEKGKEALGARADATGEYFRQTYGISDFRLWHGNGKIFAFVDGHARFWPVGHGPWVYDFRPPLGNNDHGPGYCGGQIDTTTDNDGGPGKNLPP